MSTLNVDKVDPSTGTALEIGSSGDTITIPSGATITNSGTATGFGATLSGSTDNNVVTVTGANAMQGEARLLFDGQNLSITDGGTGAEGKLNFGDAADADVGRINYNHATNYMTIFTDGSEQLRITSAGKVGIGDPDPKGTLHVKSATSGNNPSSEADEGIFEGSGSSGISILSGNSNNGYILFGDDGDNDIGQIKYQHDDNSLRFITGASERMRITNGSQTLVGKSSEGISNVGTEIGGAGVIMLTATAVPTLKLNRKSGHGEIQQFYYGDTKVGEISVDGSSTSYNTSSDYRLKENETFITDGITRIKQLKPYRFNFKTDADKTVDGFFAHEVSSIVPEAISGEKDAMHPEVLYSDAVLYTAEDELPEGNSIGDVKTPADELPEGKNFGDVKEEAKINAQGIDQAKLVPLLTSALQEAITKIETLEAKVTALENA